MTLTRTFRQFKDFQSSVKLISRTLAIKAVEESRKTCLYDLHIQNNGKMMDFSGWLLPLQYCEEISASHLYTRANASLFDVGHMLQSYVSGRNSNEFLESLTTSDLQSLPQGCATLTVFTNNRGGILDDLIITKDREDLYFVVSNASRRNEDIELMMRRQAEMKSQDKDVNIKFLDPLEQGLIALQGPRAAKILQTLVKIDLTKLKFMNSLKTKINQRQIRITRCGYTGEDGFEISVNANDAQSICQMILDIPNVKLAGLGARNTLRLEAGLCLYGHDINESTTPVEASLQWLIAKRRRIMADFPGARFILEQIIKGPTKKRVGLTLNHGPTARENAAISTTEGVRIGRVTSGGPSPTLGRPIAMGYVPLELTHTGIVVFTEIRGKMYKAIVTKMPFIKNRYYAG